MQRKNYLLMPLKSIVRNIFCKKMFAGNRNNLRGTQLKSIVSNIPYAQAKCKRSGFAMIMAVVVMIVVATIMMFTLKQTTQTAKTTADIYLYEQSILHTKSAIEYALFRIAGHDTATLGCLDNLTFQLPPLPATRIYDININMRYVYQNFTCGGAVDYIDTITDDMQDGSVLMDITVRVDDEAVGGSEPITYFRRTIQKL